jgi:hypothetical protein
VKIKAPKTANHEFYRRVFFTGFGKTFSLRFLIFTEKFYSRFSVDFSITKKDKK